MKPSTALQIHSNDIRRIVLHNGARNPRVFGSASRGNDVEGSDLDILVDPIQGRTTLFSLASIQIEIEELTGIKTEVLTHPAPCTSGFAPTRWPMPARYDSASQARSRLGARYPRGD